jgi:hypothetical protein
VLKSALSKEPNIVGISFHLSEDRESSSFLIVMFSCYLEFQTMDKIPKPNDSKCHTPS